MPLPPKPPELPELLEPPPIPLPPLLEPDELPTLPLLPADTDPALRLAVLDDALPGLRRLGRLPSRKKRKTTYQSLKELKEQRLPHFDEHTAQNGLI